MGKFKLVQTKRKREQGNESKNCYPEFYLDLEMKHKETWKVKMKGLRYI